MRGYFLVLAACSAAVTVHAQLSLPIQGKLIDCTSFPPINTIPPSNPTFNSGIDLTGIPQITPNKYDPNGDICAQNAAAQGAGYCNAECGCRRSESEHVDCLNSGEWGNTYDDGPSNNTKTVLATLKKYNSTAMFFVIGSNVCQNPQALIDAVNAGHEIGAHTWSHPRLTSLTNEQIVAEMKWTEQAIMNVIGVKPKFMRPPFGNLDDRVRFIMQKMGYTPVIWSDGADTNDWNFNWKPATASLTTEAHTDIIGNITQYINTNKGSLKGTISLEHDISPLPAQNADAVLQAITGGGWKPVPVTQCVNANTWAQNLLTGGGGGAGGSGTNSNKTSPGTPTSPLGNEPNAQAKPNPKSSAPRVQASAAFALSGAAMLIAVASLF